MFARVAQRLTSLFSYDADDHTGSNNNVVPVAAAQPTLSDTAMMTNDAPGYGEEPEVAYDPVSFDTEPQGQDAPANGTYNDYQVQEARETQPPRERYNVNMKEDG